MYALDLELHDIGDTRNLDSIKFISITNKHDKVINCDTSDSKQFKLCKSHNNIYFGVSPILFNNKILGYIVSSKKYATVLTDPVKYDLFLILLSVFGIFFINCGLLFFPLKKKIEINTNQLLQYISDPDISNREPSQLDIEEYKTIALTFIKEREEILILQKERSYYQAKKNIAAQVAHDIRSPLTAINIAIADLASIPENRRVMIKNASQRINDIANNLLEQHVNDFGTQNNRITDAVASEMIYFVLENIISEKNYEHHGKQFEILLSCPDKAYSCFSKINLAVFKRVLSNLINNSIESVCSNGFVKISLKCDAQFIELTVLDNGCGIPGNILPKITEEGFSFGKKSGAGFGLFHAKQHIENLHGALDIQSEVGVGTAVIIKLLRDSLPKWFCETLTINHDSRIVILDDDTTIHDSWVDKLSKFPDIRLKHYSGAADLIAETDRMADVYLVDYELLAENITGLDVIEKMRLNSRAILVTSCFEDAGIRKRCEILGIKIIPKPYVQFISIVISSTPINPATVVFIDDDELMRMTWLFAADQAGKSVDVYAHPNEFIAQINKYHRNTIIYIDSELGDGLSGQLYAKELYNKGFEQLYLATGHSADKFGTIPWLKAVVNKNPPFTKNGTT